MAAKFIIAHCSSDGGEVFINPEHIGHIYAVKPNTQRDHNGYTVIGVTTHNNGGFQVKETPKQILALIEKLNK